MKVDMAKSIAHRQREILALLIATALIALGTGCILQPEPRPVVTTTLAPHPRLFFSSRDLPELRMRAASTHRQIWSPVLAFAESQLGEPSPQLPKEGDLDGYRNAGNRVIAFAFAYVITERSAFLDLTRRHLLAYTTWPHWGDENQDGDRDLGFHHLLMGSTIAYDWVYDGLSEDERRTIRDSLARRAQESYEASTAIESEWSNWWRKAYTQNHHWTNHSALGLAALALRGEDDRAEEWLGQATDNLLRVRHVADGVADGSWHEGTAYQSYGITMTLPFLYSLRRLEDRDLIPHTYLRNYVYWKVYNLLPNSSKFALPFADYDWQWGIPYGPEGALRFAAREYRDGRAEWVAQQMVDQSGRKPDVWNAPWYVFEFLYYDPTVSARPPSDLPLDRTFPDLEGVIWRTGWGPNDLIFGLKTGAPGGRFLYDTFTRGEKYPFDPDSRVDRFHVGHDHDDANSFYLYRGNVDLSSEVVGNQRTDTSYHNSLLVNGQGQYRDPGGGNDWDRDTSRYRDIDGRLEASYGTRSFSYLMADATNRYRTVNPRDGSPGDRLLDEFRRHVLFAKPNYLVMVDSLRSSEPHMYEWVSHFGRSVSLEDDWVKGSADSGQTLGVRIVHPESFAASIDNDGKPYVRVRLHEDSASVRFVTVLFPTEAENWSSRPGISSLGDDDQATGVRVLLDGTRDHMVRHAATGRVAIGDYLLDGQAASVDWGADNRIRKLFLGRGRELSDQRGSRTLIRSSHTISAIEVEYRGSDLLVFGEMLAGASIYAPEADTGRVTVNGRRVQPTRDGDYIVLP